jgi:hypothetical protein
MFEIIVNQSVQVLELLLFSLRNSRLMVKAWVQAKVVPIGGI